ncbi:xanthine dehydrogenase family protein subunit M [Saccharopolyspora sp. HNM0983]|uniref:Xanthine dehydrogenase family protein subunit M n=1 Tax=Saccharopolyspora montiporae TaxID=2781240 RepID=A0A929BD27_9PSEU|nr:xanthine dehydrogenase family protein subunit M [Saccharopolyspora sp. HNM0983]MBE9376530.1 xanthine dehydrogenase family protein subunit M [Saccharopolyspora sp. HNM0983]
MIPAPFTYKKAGSIDEALQLLGEHGDDAKLLAGGHSLLPLMKLRLAVPEVLIDLGALHDLAHITADGDQVRIGALTRHRELESSALLAEQVPLLAHAAGTIGDPQVRHRGTIGGSLAHGDAASDLPAVLLALDGVLVVRGPSGQREVPAAEFFTDFFETAVGEDELLTEIRVPANPGEGWDFQKFTKRAIDWAMVGAAVAGDRIGLINMGPTPLRARGVEEALASGSDISAAAQRAAEGTSPPDEPGASAEYRAHLARVLVRRGLETARARRA